MGIGGSWVCGSLFNVAGEGGAGVPTRSNVRTFGRISGFHTARYESHCCGSFRTGTKSRAPLLAEHVEGFADMGEFFLPIDEALLVFFQDGRGDFLSEAR